MIRYIDGGGKVHEEVLRLLISAVEAGLLVKTERLAAYLERTIQHSKKSRKHAPSCHAVGDASTEMSNVAWRRP